MNIQYNNLNGQIISVYFDEFHSPIATGTFSTFVVDETSENKSTIFSLIQDVFEHTGEFTIVNNQLLHNGQAVTLNTDSEFSQLRTEYQTAVDRLLQIENAGAIPFTQAGFNQVVQAVKDIAHYVRLIAKLLAKILKTSL